MNLNFQVSLAFTLKWEGGAAYTNDPNDPGRETRYGISKRYHPNLDIKNLTIDQAKIIYEQEYWIASGANVLPWPLCLAVFDSAVNPGVNATFSFLRDDSMQQQTSAMGRALVLCNLREQHYEDLAQAHPSKREYLHGWKKRVDDVWEACQQPEPCKNLLQLDANNINLV